MIHKILWVAVLVLFAAIAGRAQNTIFVPTCSGSATADTAALTALKTVLGSTNPNTVQFPAKTDPTKLCKLNSITFPANITLDFTKGGIQGVTGQTITIGSMVAPPDRKVFYNFLSGQASIVFSRLPLQIPPDWWGAKPDNGTTDGTAAINAALVAGGGGQIVLNPGYYLITSVVTAAVDGTQIVGAGFYVSGLLCNLASSGNCLDVIKSGGAAQISHIVLRDFQVSSTQGAGSAVRKTGIRITEVSNLAITRIKVNGMVSSGKDSIGIQFRGREVVTFEGSQSTADKPIQISDDPNSIFDFDSFNFQDIEAVADVTQPCVTVDSGVNVSQWSVGGRNNWVQCKSVLYWNDTATSSAANGVTWAGENRWEQNTSDIAYAVDISHNTGLHGLTLSGFRGGGVHGNFFRFRNVNHARIERSDYEGSLIAINADSTVTKFDVDPYSNDFNWPESAGTPATVSISGFISWTGLYSGCPGYCLRTPLLASSGTTNGGTGQLIPATGDGPLTRGEVTVIVGGGDFCRFAVTGANHVVKLIEDTGSKCSVADTVNGNTASKVNAWYDGAKYAIRNNMGTGFAFTNHMRLDTLN